MKKLIVRLLGLYINTVAIISPKKAGRIGFVLFCRPFKAPLSQKQKEYLNTADRFTVQLDEVSVQGYRWGTGARKILFLHGWQSHTYRWKAYIDALPKDEYTVYALDAPGHGQSGGNFLSVPVYSELIQQFLLELGEVHTVVGHSLGGFSLLYTFYRYPLLSVNKVILMAPPGEATDFIDFYQTTLSLSARAMRYINRHFTEQYQVGPEYFSTAKFASSVNVNGLIIHDEGDAEAPYHYAKTIHGNWKRSKMITTNGFGHNLKSPSVVKEVVNFIQETHAAARATHPAMSDSAQEG
jgi:pimeloyl-ACP methyl ester carboxylesterase